MLMNLEKILYNAVILFAMLILSIGVGNYFAVTQYISFGFGVGLGIFVLKIIQIRRDHRWVIPYLVFSIAVSVGVGFVAAYIMKFFS